MVTAYKKIEYSKIYLIYTLVYAGLIFFNPLLYLYGLEIPKEVFLGTSDGLDVAMDMKNGRFYPLANVQYNFILNYLEMPVYYCFIYRAIQFIIFSYIFFRIGIKFSTTKYSFLSFFILTITPTFINNWLDYFTVEVELSFLYLILAICLYKYEKKHNAGYLLITILIINIAIYLKEIVFVGFALLALVYFTFDKNKNKNKNYFFGLLLISALIFIITYYIFIYYEFSNLNLPRYGASTNLNYWVILLKSGINFIYNDFIVVCLIFILVYHRLIKIIQFGFNFEILNDSLIILSISYFLSYLALNIFALNYLLPIYCMLLIPFFQLRLSKKFLISGIIIYVVLLFPLSLNQLTARWAGPVNYKASLIFIENYLSQHQTQNINIYFDGLSRAPQHRSFAIKYDRGIELNFANDLIRNGFYNFDICSELEADSGFSKSGYSDYPISFYNKYNPTLIKSGDILIVAPHSKNNITKSYLSNLSVDHELLFSTSNSLAIPNFSLKNIIKFLLIDGKIGQFMNDKNIERLPTYYFYIKK
jgi:hypothetical protein